MAQEGLLPVEIDEIIGSKLWTRCAGFKRRRSAHPKCGKYVIGVAVVSPVLVCSGLLLVLQRIASGKSIVHVCKVDLVRIISMQDLPC